jgi:formiminoglutamase
MKINSKRNYICPLTKIPSMLEHWLSPISTNKIPHFDTLHEECFGNKMLLHTEGGIPDIKKTQIALIGIGTEDANAVRSVLYGLSFPFLGLQVADLGNVRKQETSFIIPLLTELLQGDIVPILIGHSEIFTLAQYQAYQSKKGAVNLTVIDEKIRFTPKVTTENYFLHQILEDSHLFNCSIVGYQAHFTPPSVSDWFERRNFELVRLGRVKNTMEDIEPVIRDADMVSFNIAALKLSEAPAQLEGTPSGFFSEEACQIARYAGMSDKLTSFGIYGFHHESDKNTQTAQILAQMIWYFTDGFYNRKQDFPISKAFNQLTQYVVDIKSFDFQITFWKSNKSGRWWMEIPVKTRKKYERHRLVPCSYNDYLQACQDDLPDRLVNAVQRFK